MAQRNPACYNAAAVQQAFNNGNTDTPKGQTEPKRDGSLG